MDTTITNRNWMREVFKWLLSLPVRILFHKKLSRIWTNSSTAQVFIKDKFVLTQMLLYPYSEDQIDYAEDTTDYIRLCSMELLAKRTKEKKFPGAIAEVGVFRGAFARQMSKAFPDRTFYLFDTFEGFPEEDLKLDYSKGYDSLDQDFSSTSVEYVLSKIPARNNCIVKKGYFPQTAEGLDEKFIFVNLDTDLYKSIYDGLNYFYPRLTPGGAIFVHDYNNTMYPGAKEAVDKYIEEHPETVPMYQMPDKGGTAVLLK